MKIKDYVVSVFNEYKARQDTAIDAEGAYTAGILHRAGTLAETYRVIYKNVLQEIKDYSRMGHVERYIAIPDWVTATQRTRLEKELVGLGYQIPYRSEISMIVSWAHLQKD